MPLLPLTAPLALLASGLFGTALFSVPNSIETEFSPTHAVVTAAAPEAPRHLLPEGVHESDGEFRFRRSGESRVFLLDDLSDCAAPCGYTELANDGSRTRFIYDDALGPVDMDPISDANLTILLGAIEDIDLHELAQRSFRPDDWQVRGARMAIAVGSETVILPPLGRVGDGTNMSLDAFVALSEALGEAWIEPPRIRTGIRSRSIPGGRAVEVDYWETPISAGPERCTASINANWLTPDHTATYGLAVFDGETVPGTFDDHDRGIFGERRGVGADLEEFQWDFTGKARINVLSNMAWRDGARLQLHSNFWTAGLWGDQNEGWDWAVSGITLLTDGNLSADMSHTYTFNTRRHPFVAFRPPSTVTFGATIDMTALELVQYLQGEGYTDIMKFDGGGSVELNEGGIVTVGGTDRPITTWLGIGC